MMFISTTQFLILQDTMFKDPLGSDQTTFLAPMSQNIFVIRTIYIPPVFFILELCSMNILINLILLCPPLPQTC